MAWGAFQVDVGKLVGLGMRFVAQGCHGLAGAALRHHVTRAAFAAAALGGDTELKLDLVKAHARAGMACDFTVGDAAANTDDHGDGPDGWLLKK